MRSENWVFEPASSTWKYFLPGTSIVNQGEYSLVVDYCCINFAFYPQEDKGIYHEKVRGMIRKNEYRLIVNINDLRRKNEKRAIE